MPRQFVENSLGPDLPAADDFIQTPGEQLGTISAEGDGGHLVIVLESDLWILCPTVPHSDGFVVRCGCNAGISRHRRCDIVHDPEHQESKNKSQVPRGSPESSWIEVSTFHVPNVTFEEPTHFTGVGIPVKSQSISSDAVDVGPVVRPAD